MKEGEFALFLNKRVKKINKKQESWKIEKRIIEREEKIRQQKHALKQQKKKRHTTTTKLLTTYLFGSCTLIQLFTGYITYRTLDLAAITQQPFDFTPLVALIGAVVGEVFAFAIYIYKSTKENCVGGIIYDSALKQENQPYKEDTDRG